MSSSPAKIRKFFFWIKRILKWFLCVVAIYVIVVLVGLIPMNNGFAEADSGVTIHVVSNEVHADIIVPVKSSSVDWSEEFAHASFGDSVDDQTHLAIGWGDKGFFLHTPTWEDLKLSVAANALLLPSECCVHVVHTRPELHEGAVSVTISEEQYVRLVEQIKQTLKRSEDGKFIQISGYAYSTNDAFFEANGRYHLLNTCNSWVGRCLKAAGVRVPWLSPLPKTPMLYFD